MLNKKPTTKPIQRKNTSILSEDRLYEALRQSKIQPNPNRSNIPQPRVMLFILGMSERIDFTKTPIVTLGRFDTTLQKENQLDLQAYGAMDRGVSRVHCQLELQDGLICVTDLGSSNGTYISGKRLIPHQTYVLNKGEELILGLLPIQIISAR